MKFSGTCEKAITLRKYSKLWNKYNTNSKNLTWPNPTWPYLTFPNPYRGHIWESKPSRRHFMPDAKLKSYQVSPKGCDRTITIKAYSSVLTLEWRHIVKNFMMSFMCSVVLTSGQRNLNSNPWEAYNQFKPIFKTTRANHFGGKPLFFLIYSSVIKQTGSNP